MMALGTTLRGDTPSPRTIGRRGLEPTAAPHWRCRRHLRSSVLLAGAVVTASPDLVAAVGDGAGADASWCWSSLTADEEVAGQPGSIAGEGGWYWLCCLERWSGCWGHGRSEALCCSGDPWQRSAADAGAPALGASSAAASSAALQPRRLAELLGLRPQELPLLLTGLEALHARSPKHVSSDGYQEVACFEPEQCVRETFARLFGRLRRAGLAPLRHPWDQVEGDPANAMSVRLAAESDGSVPPNGEHIVEYVQAARFLKDAAQVVYAGFLQRQKLATRGRTRCLTWDEPEGLERFFAASCAHLDVISYDPSTFAQRSQRRPSAPERLTSAELGSGGLRSSGSELGVRYRADILRANETMPAESFFLVACLQVFEHLRRPWEAMHQLRYLLEPGGYVAWSAPAVSPLHGVPDDYYRYTPQGAVSLAVDAGLDVVELYAPGDAGLVAGLALGVTAPYYRFDEMTRDGKSQWPMMIFMLLRRPLGARRKGRFLPNLAPNGPGAPRAKPPI
eukprot:TRINITY_DN16184_c0_g1_i1.p1 TRINITY_DN16184_c0_g1~~TRINITY_DN16184_c0_g1_i1.p1  ORF type:complete len:524 (+),score=109.45 TRINITY_DN16184_c0_g1_i1:49-1572(+)